MCKISIIIPIYNVENYLEKCFNSIIKQKNMCEAEIICIDDGSTDNSGKICDQYANNDKRFKVIHQKNLGVAKARNVGLNVAQGKYIAWVDPDDYIADNWYERINLFMDKNIDIIFFDYAFFIDNTIKKVKYGNKSGFVEKNKFLKELVLDKRVQSQLWSKVMKKTLFYNIKIPVDLKILEDYAIMHYLIERANTIYYISDCLYFYLIRKNSLLNDKIKIEDDYKAYLVAKKRYKYLIGKNLEISRIEYLTRAFHVYVRLCHLKILFEDNKNKFDICKKELKNNIKYILLSRDANINFKIKSILVKFNLLRILLKIKDLLKNKV